MEKFRNITQVFSVVVVAHISFLLLTRGAHNGLEVTAPSLLFILAIVVGVLFYLRYLSRGDLEFRLNLQSSHYLLPILFSYGMMLVISGLGTYFLMLDQSEDLLGNQEALVNLFINSSIFLLGFDMVALSPLVPSFLQFSSLLKKREITPFLLGVLVFALLSNPAHILCFLFYVGAGFCFSKLFQKKFKRLEISILAHVLRNSLICLLLTIL